MHAGTGRRRAVAVVAAHPCCRIRFPSSWWGSKRRVTGGGAELKFLLSLAVALLFSQVLFAQTATLRGQITDATGAVITRAKATLHGDSGALKSTVADNNGSYAFVGVTPGDYTVQASAPELSLAKPARMTLLPGSQTLNLTLQVEIGRASCRERV